MDQERSPASSLRSAEVENLILEGRNKQALKKSLGDSFEILPRQPERDPGLAAEDTAV